LADSAGVSIEKITEIIQSLYPQWGRLEKIPSKAKSSVFVDFAHCDDALSKVLSTVREFTTGKVWAVFGAGGDRDRAKRALMGAAAVQNADKVIITSDNPRTEDPLDIIADIVEGIPAGSDVKVEPDRAKAIRLALDNAEENDSVVVCGKGHETSQEINGIFYPFDDREEIRKYEP
jgi:UDP-N-acetylmuramoyl-L-alanyl-D-glutamate--2,6-diaminopimelate ligase